MPIPFILAGVALAAAGYGVKKGLDAKEDFDVAEGYNKEAQKIYDQSEKKLENTRIITQDAIEELGRVKFHIYENDLVNFVDVFRRIKNIDFKDATLANELGNLDLTQAEFLSISDNVFSLKETLGGGIAALGAGGLAGFAAYGSVGMLATASTGTAIGTLSGAAATNATLAWLGGGALSAGGFGMAGGMAVLGGIVAGPVLAAGGMMLASKAEEARHNAYANLQEAKLLVEEMQNAIVRTREIGERFIEVQDILIGLQQWFSPLLEELTDIVLHKQNYPSYSVKEKQTVMLSFATAKVLKDIMETKILADDGSLLDINQKLNAANQHLDTIIAAAA